MAEQQVDEKHRTNISAFINDPKIRGLFYQIILIAVIIFFVWEIVQNTIANLERQNIASGLEFLGNTAGFGIIQSLIDYSEVSSYGTALLVGVYNTILVAIVGIFFATILGFLVGIARLSNNWIINKIAYCYIEIVRNIPLLLQIFFWYFAALRAVPGKRDYISFFDIFYLNITGLRAPLPIFYNGSELVWISF